MVDLSQWIRETYPVKEVVYSAEMAIEPVSAVRSDLNRLGDRVGWAIAIAVLGFGVLFAWIFIKLPDKRLEEFKEERERTGLEISKQLAPLTVQLASLTAVLELRNPDAAKQLGPGIRKLSSDRTDAPRFLLDLHTTKQLAEKARLQNITGDRADISGAGQSLAAISFEAGSPVAQIAWDTTLELARYISFLNSHAHTVVDRVNEEAAAAGIKTPVVGVFVRQESGTSPNGVSYALSGAFTIDGVSIYKPSIPGDYTAVPKNLAAHVNGKGVKMGEVWPAFIVLENYTIILDGLNCRNVIFRQCKIVYHEGGFHLENSQFNNCSFEVPHTQSGKNLILAVLGPASVKAEGD